MSDAYRRGGLPVLGLVVGLAVWATGCPDDGADKVCDPGETQSCDCLDGDAGVQVCREDGGGWEECECGGGDDDDTASASIAELDWRLHEEIESLVYVTWTQGDAATTHVEFSFDEGEWRSSPSRQTDPGEVEALLLGIPYDTEFTFRVVYDLGDGPVTTDEVEAETGELPDDFPVPELVASDPDAYEPTGRYLLSSINAYNGGWTGGDYYKFIMDRQARIVWTLLTPDNSWSIYLRVSLDGDDILWDDFTYWSGWDDGADSRVHRMKIDGTIVESTPTPGGHHAFTELLDGTIVWGAASWWSETLEKIGPDGIQRTVWDCTEFLDAIGEGDYCQSNALYWHEAYDSYLYSFYSTSHVVEIDGPTGATLNIWGHVNGAWAFEPEESAFYWQHGATFTDEGTLLLSTYADSDSSELVVREYELDEAAGTLREIWSFGEGEGIHGDTAGEAHRLAGGNTLHNYGSGCRLREVTPDGTVVWDVDWEGSKLLGRSVFFDDLYAFAP